MELKEQYYSAEQRHIIHKLGVLNEKVLEKLPVKQSDIAEAFPPWPKRCSIDYLRTDVFDVRFVHTNDEEDGNETRYVFVTPDEDINFPGGIRTCPHCGKTGSNNITRNGFASPPRQIDDIPELEKKVTLVIMRSRFICAGCKRTFNVKWDSFAADKKGHSFRHYRKIGEDALKKVTFSEVAYTHHVDDETVRQMFLQEVERRRREVKLETPAHIGIDEAKVHTKNGSSFYVAILATGNEQVANNGVIEFDTVRRNAETIKEVFRRFDNPGAVETITMDMCKAYREAAEDVLPKARIIVDKFHLVKSLNEKTAAVVKDLYKKTKKELDDKIGVVSIPDEFDPALDPDFMDFDALMEEAFETMDDEFILPENSHMFEIPPGTPEKERLRMKREILKDCYHHRWFTMKPQSLSDLSALKICNLFANFPEFKRVYDIKELLRHNFFDADTAEEAKMIAQQVKDMIRATAFTISGFENL